MSYIIIIIIMPIITAMWQMEKFHMTSYTP